MNGAAAHFPQRDNRAGAPAWGVGHTARSVLVLAGAVVANEHPDTFAESLVAWGRNLKGIVLGGIRAGSVGGVGFVVQ